jgi:PAS domain S-box-containing protein
VIELFGRSSRPVEERIVAAMRTVAAQLGAIVERKRVDDALRNSNAQFARLSESGLVGIAFADVHGNTYDANDAYLHLLGFTREDLAAGLVRWDALTPPEWQPADAAAVEALTHTGVAQPWEKEMIRKDGTRVPVQIGVAMLDAPRCIAIVSDLTDRRRAERALRETEDQLRHAQKMEAVGRLAGGVAHDFNNLLSIILSLSDLLLQDLRPGDPMRDDVEEIQAAGRRAADLTRQLLLFSRQQVVETRVLDLNRLLLGVDKMLQRILGADVALAFAPAADLGHVRADACSLEQVVLNLAVNARDAMPTGGSLTLETCNRIVGPDDAPRRGVAPGSYVCLAVTDTGVGMDQATQARIFEPFFTTKERGKGTGLGLSTVFGIVRQAGGHVCVESAPGRGARFEVLFPRVDAPATAAEQPAATTTLRGSESVLLVEDDDRLRGVARSILERRGYSVTAARDAAEAIDRAQGSSRAIDLLLTDVVLPGLGGSALAERLERLYPRMKVLFTSGYTDDSVLRHGVDEGKVAFLQKPFTPDSLAAKVRATLDAPSARAR